MQIQVLFAILVAVLPVSAWQAPAAAVRAPINAASSTLTPLRAGRVQLQEDWSFGDAAGEVSSETATALVEEEERELTEKEKEIARLRAAEKFMMKDTGNARCKTCGFVYKWEEGAMPQVPKKTPFAMVPNAFSCPSCKSPKAFFEPEQIEIAGFADNQAYGFGTNTWTEGQKSNAIFGGLAAFFVLLLGGYALN